MPRKSEEEIDKELGITPEDYKVSSPQLRSEPTPEPMTRAPTFDENDGEDDVEELENRDEKQEEILKDDGVEFNEPVEQDARISPNQPLIDNTVGEIESEFDTKKLLLQGTKTFDGKAGDGMPWDLRVAKVREADRPVIRAEGEALNMATEMFGADSWMVSQIREELHTDIKIMTASDGYLGDLLITTRNVSTVDKNVNRQDRLVPSKPGLFGGNTQEPQKLY